MTLSIFAEQSGTPKKEFDPSTVPEAGSQLGILVQVIDLGVQPAREFRDPKTGVVDKKRPQRTARLTFELPNDMIETDEGMKPKVIGIDMNLSSNDKSRCFNWYRVFDAAMRDNGDWFAQLGKGILLTIVHEKAKSGSKYDGWTFAKIGGITPLLKGMTVPEAVNPLVSYSPSSHNQDVFNALPRFIQDKINNRIGGEKFPQPEREQRQESSPQPQQRKPVNADQDW